MWSWKTPRGSHVPRIERGNVCKEGFFPPKTIYGSHRRGVLDTAEKCEPESLAEFFRRAKIG